MSKISPALLFGYRGHVIVPINAYAREPGGWARRRDESDLKLRSLTFVYSRVDESRDRTSNHRQDFRLGLW
jgi:hypothetical protein